MRASSFRRSPRLTCPAMSALLGGCGCKSRDTISRTWGTVSAGVFFPQLSLLPFQEPQGQHRERHVVMPTHPTAHLIMTQPRFPFAGGEQLLCAVPPTVNGHDLNHRHIGRCVRQRVPRLRLPIRGANDDQPFARTDAAVFVFGLPPRFGRPPHFRSFGSRAEADLPPPPL